MLPPRRNLLLLATFARELLRLLPTRRYHLNPYRYGARRNHALLGSFLPIVALIAIDRLLDLRR